MPNHKLGVLSLFMAASLYGLYGIFSRLIGTSFGNFSQNYIRNLFVLAIITSVIFLCKLKLAPVLRKDMGWIILWFLSGSWVTVLTFIGFNHLQIGTTYLVIYSAMIFSGFLSGRVFFGERMNLKKTLALLLAFSGLLVIYNFTISPSETFYVFLVFVSGFMTGVWNTVSKKFSGNYPNSQLIAMDAFSSVIAAFMGAAIFKEGLPDASSIKWFWVFVYGFVQMVNVGLVVYGFKNLEAQLGSIILPVEIVFAILFSYLIFGEVPGLAAFVGGILIVFSAVLPSLSLRR